MTFFPSFCGPIFYNVLLNVYSLCDKNALKRTPATARAVSIQLTQRRVLGGAERALHLPQRSGVI